MLQSSEVPNSSWCEIEGLKRSIGLLRQHDLHLSTLITDRHRQVAKWVREELCPEGTQHYLMSGTLGKSSMAAVKLEGIITRTSLLKDVRQPVSASNQTYSLEDFHSPDPALRAQAHWVFIPWHASLSGAALQLQCNREDRTKKRWFGEVMQTSLIEALRESYMNSPKALQEVSANLSACAPAPIAKSFQQIPKEEAVSLYLAQQSRFKKLN
ncbi:unnamed protein product [Boreogadus saida]